MAVETKRICNGTFGELWLDGDYSSYRAYRNSSIRCR